MVLPDGLAAAEVSAAARSQGTRGAEAGAGADRGGAEAGGPSSPRAVRQGPGKAGRASAETQASAGICRIALPSLIRSVACAASASVGIESCQSTCES